MGDMATPAYRIEHRLGYSRTTMGPALAARGGGAHSGALSVVAEEFSMQGFARGEEAVMTDDRPYIQANDRARERLRAFIARLDDEALAAPANEYWTVAGVLGHLAYWDARVLVLADKIDRGEPWVPSDAEPEGDWLTDSTRPIIQAIAPRAAAELALRIAEETDARVAALPLDRMAPFDPESPIYPARGEHRGEHLDELERALRDRG